MMHYFFLSLNVLNGLLALAVAGIVYFVVIPVLEPVTRISLPTAKGTVASSGNMAAPARDLPAADYAVISNKNLFHPERMIPPEKQPEKVVPKPDVFLYGTLIAGDASYAFIEDKKAPHSTPGRGKRQITLKKGDNLSGYTLGEIEANRIVFIKGEDRVVVMLNDQGKRRTSDTPGTARTATAAPPPASPGAPSSPQFIPSSTPAAASPGPGIAGPPARPSPPPTQPSLSSAPQAAPSSPQDASTTRPGGIGTSGTWPPTRSSVEQTRQKIEEGRQMRAGQMKGNQ